MLVGDACGVKRKNNKIGVCLAFYQVIFLVIETMSNSDQQILLCVSKGSLLFAPVFFISDFLL